MEMTKRERIKAALAGKAVDRVPVGFWRHWPGDDQQAESLALVALEFQQRYDLDFIKIPVSSTCQFSSMILFFKPADATINLKVEPGG